MKSLQGNLLVAAPTLLDPNFARAVVLIVQHGEQGALGLVLNRPLDVSVREACEPSVDLPVGEDAILHQGGPCQGPLMVVHNEPQSAEIEVASGVYFTTERRKIESLLDGSAAAIKFFVGYAGWGAGQLEAEMETGSWLTAEARSAVVFDEDSRLWNRITDEIRLGRFIDPDRIPDDPSVN